MKGYERAAWFVIGKCKGAKDKTMKNEADQNQTTDIRALQ